MMIPNTKSGAGETKRRVPDETFAVVGPWQLSDDSTTDWYFNAGKPAPAPHLAYPKGCAALHIVIVTVPRACRSCEIFSSGFDLHFLQRGDEAAKRYIRTGAGPIPGKMTKTEYTTHTHTHTHAHTHTHTHTQTQPDRQTDIQTDRHRHTHTHTHVTVAGRDVPLGRSSLYLLSKPQALRPQYNYSKPKL